MKNYITLLAIAFLGVIIFFSCKKSSSGSGKAVYSMNATINGATFTTKTCTAVVNGDELSISAGAHLPFITIIIQNYAGSNTYNVVPPTYANPVSNAAYVDSSSTLAPATSIYGSVVIDSTSPNLTGSFNFMAVATYLDTVTDAYTVDSVQVSNGTFVAKVLP